VQDGKRQEQIEQSIQRYLTAVGDRADAHPTGGGRSQDRAAAPELATLAGADAAAWTRSRMSWQSSSPDGELSPDRLGRTRHDLPGEGTGVVGYNVQTVVYTAHHLM